MTAPFPALIGTGNWTGDTPEDPRGGDAAGASGQYGGLCGSLGAGQSLSQQATGDRYWGAAVSMAVCALAGLAWADPPANRAAASAAAMAMRMPTIRTLVM